MTSAQLSTDRQSRSASSPNSAITQFVTPQGTLTLEGRAHGVDIDLTKTLYRDMMLARRLDSEARALQRQGELNLWLMSFGQEAAQVGSVRALRDTDMVFPSYREHAAGLCRGLTPAQLMTQWRGCAHSGWDPRTYRFHIYSLVLGTQTLHATGYAAGVTMDGTDEVVAVYFGDGASSQGDVNEALNWAAASKLPVLFFCQNNQWAISTPTELQMGAPLHRRAEGFGMRSFHVDGNDVLAVHAVTAQAAEYARAGNGPVLIEARTYRRGGHSSSDDPGRYRRADELELWESRDPLTRIRALLGELGATSAYFDEVDDECATFGQTVRDQCRAIAAPQLEETFASTYVAPHPVIDDERRRFAAARLATGMA
ncbi:thiamine pyrophosphate-dependent enzyme [Mycolicibacterium goodii]|uniref:thiamine pyrophosphate-dependent enzyme n=1 Tax=Mycolicibacterium goodii TaxID=134601 RepID=UPI001BDBC19D|nr:thiamine pyrophosphate-dependent enzyme [Mycolicibacterium goodii]MBU8817245.1 pyruvate dehydrogenase (acetyl-transferring) E1 component subunit alpha [Mycolicibacterium goodii]MBU8828410.1 pyruvate dehydrogenase (acetyl-transferring) E1 component subunit alpha [Mycolicibacterium goodii]